MTAGSLSHAEVTVLELERTWWPDLAAKELAIRERLVMTPSEYYQLLNALLDEPAAMAHDPLVVRRLRRTREARRRSRSAVRASVDLD